MKNKHLSGGLFAARRAPLTLKETPLSMRIAEYLNARSIYNDRLNCGQIETKSGSWLRLCKPGTPDRFCIVRGRVVFIEVKMRDRKPTFTQNRQHDALRHAGAIVIVADDFDSFRNQFDAIRAAIEKREKEINLYD